MIFTDWVEWKGEQNDCSAGFASPALASEGVLTDEFNELFHFRFITRHTNK